MDAEARCNELFFEDSANDGSGSFKIGDCTPIEMAGAAAIGIMGGLVDVFLVGAPGEDRVLERWSDKQVDHAVEAFAKLSGWKPSSPDDNNVAHAIDHLERTFKVNYDQRYGADVGGFFDMNTRNHHMMSLAHSPDIVGLFFSLLNQFTSTATFASESRLITIRTDLFDVAGHEKSVFGFELQGGSIPAKIFCGVFNWIGHVMSDIAGTSITGRVPGQGMGVPAPFFEMLQFCNVGSFQYGNRDGNLSDLAIKVFENGYDARFAVALSVPVLTVDLVTKLVWSLIQYFRYERPVAECLPAKSNDSLRTMLLIGNGTLCAIDVSDAFIRSGGGANALELVSRLNYVAWLRMTMLVIRELRIRLSLERDIEAMKRLNEAYRNYIDKLEKIDIEGYKRQSIEYQEFSENLSTATTEEELNSLLHSEYEELGIDLPWEGDFNQHMANKEGTLRFV